MTKHNLHKTFSNSQKKHGRISDWFCKNVAWIFLGDLMIQLALRYIR